MIASILEQFWGGHGHKAFAWATTCIALVAMVSVSVQGGLLTTGVQQSLLPPGRMLQQDAPPDFRAVTIGDLFTNNQLPEGFGTSDLCDLQGKALADAVVQKACDYTKPASDISLKRLAEKKLRRVRLPATSNVESVKNLLYYLVSCAMEGGVKVTLSTGSQNTVFEGLYGLAPEWYNGAMSVASQELVSACMGARASFYGAPDMFIIISTLGDPRFPLLLDASEGERELYPMLEGAFWGNLFLPKPELFACTNSRNAINSYRFTRVCTTGLPVGQGFVSCGALRAVGECSQICTSEVLSEVRGLNYVQCNGRSHVITTYLPNTAGACEN